MSSSVLLCPSAMATLPLITGLAGILGGSSVSPAIQREKRLIRLYEMQGGVISSTEGGPGCSLCLANYLTSADQKQDVKNVKK